ncbi:uncharacterized protein P174DRAFT_439183 [Aspergillus novofumigatus IBT 16806]|uniref:Uncharacterized protein n=1 Tax=Aspergillus novofumigatus (strain IBT 16806) TaxID=1392255 RepID=A0A2I1CIF4_ASPN1|nr:uncharacterized protein P174DRAFT_439183 [Aspergillus novofumigatus IBT 16806]PKX97406.1 hypothetical protein P174DRAFT_439183 [Aspergillus novofumigatus IBT 16806]
MIVKDDSLPGVVAIAVLLLPEVVLIGYRSPRGICSTYTWGRQILLCCKLSRYPSGWDTSRKKLVGSRCSVPTFDPLCS